MKNRLIRMFVSLCLFASLLSQAPISLACGPFSLSSIFTFTVHPEYPLEDFARGQIGMVQPAYARSYLYVAYRYLAGESFNQTEQKALVELWKQRLDVAWRPETDDAVQTWLTARGKVPNVSPIEKIEVYRSREKPNEYETYLNCQTDAFRNAATTLGDRMNKFGPDNAIIHEWVAAQDQVFSNCSEGKQIPPQVGPDTNPLVKSDREYQIAAANFYAGSFDDAENMFTSIAKDKSSPWQTIAPYLLARTFVREASLGAPENRNESLTAAENQLNQILRDPAQKENYAAATRLLSLVRLRLHPETRLHELALSLLKENQNEALKQDLWDYTVLLDQLVFDDDDKEKPDVPSAVRADELTDWITTYQSPKTQSLQHSISKWQAGSSIPWLVSALSKIDAKHPQARQAIAAAAHVGPDSPAFETASFHVVRLFIEAGRFDDARAKLDDILSKYRTRLTTSGLNQLLNQRMLLSTSPDDFLVFAQRVPAAFSWNDDGLEIPADVSEVSDQTKSLRGKPLFDNDSTEILNRKLPLELLRQAAESKTLTTHLRRDVAQATWIRAVLLNDTKTADALVPTVKALIPELSTLLDEYVAANQPEAKRFTAIYAWLKFPGIEPVVDEGIGRTTPLSEQDSYRDNWWCGAAFSRQAGTESAEPGILKIKTSADYIREGTLPLFLSAAQRAAAERESTTLYSLGAAPNLLCRETIKWANTNAGDQRLPEALHLAVKSTRYGCTDTLTARWSKAAFDILHRRYPKSPWTKKTPYWFKD
jgi:tetratricopeptide (TPR) repeat protein